MSNAPIRNITRFLFAAAAVTALTLCLISVLRLVYVYRVLEQAGRAAAIGQTDSMIRELRLAYRWAPAYTPLREPARYLYRDALYRAGLADPVPEMTIRSFSAALPPLEKALIPADLLVNWLYSLYGPGPRETPSADGAARAEPSPPPTGEGKPSGEAEVTPGLPEVASDPYTGEPGTLEPPERQDASEPPAPVPEAMWGVVNLQDAAVYDQKGIKTRTVAAGSLVDIHRLQTVPAGDVIHGTVWSRSGTFPDVILRRGDVEIYQGSALSSTTRNQRELVSRRAERIAAIKELKKELANAAAIRNPHQLEYRKVLREYKRIDDEAAKIKTEFEGARGSQRMDLANRLRVLKNEQANLMPRYQDLKQKKEDWDLENRGGDLLQDPGRDPRLEQWNRELLEIEEQIRNL